MSIIPASAEHGIRFKRTDIRDRDPFVPARWNAVEGSSLRTLLKNESGLSVSTVEHVMAALAGCGVHNALIELDAPEVPILDGSSAPFVRKIMARGLRELHAPVRALRVCKSVRIEAGAASAELKPSNESSIEFHIDFSETAIGRQSLKLNMANGSFARELCDSRTFCLQSDVTAMQANGLALGGRPGENAVVFDGNRVVSPGGLRHKNEPVRHKMLDALGDLALAGGPLIGHYVGNRAGHSLTNKLLRKAFATPGALRMVTCSPEMASRLPGYGLDWSEIPQVA